MRTETLFFTLLYKKKKKNQKTQKNSKKPTKKNRNRSKAGNGEAPAPRSAVQIPRWDFFFLIFFCLFFKPTKTLFKY